MATIEEFIENAKKTKTYKEEIIAFKPYKIGSKWFGFGTILPEIPKADREHQVIILDFKGIVPVVRDVLTKPNILPEKELVSSDHSKILFIVVKSKPQRLHIQSPQNGYRFRDGEKIYINLDITYKIDVLKSFGFAKRIQYCHLNWRLSTKFKIFSLEKRASNMSIHTEN